MTEEIFRGPLKGPEPNHLLFDDENERAKYHELIERHRLEDPEISAFLDTINFEEVRRILTKHLRKSTGDETCVAHIVPRENIGLIDTQGAAALGVPEGAVMAYTSFNDQILVNLEKIRDRFRFNNIPFPLYLLYTLYHEEGHAAASHYTQTARSGHEITQIGLEHQRKQKGVIKPNSLYYVISEGVNDKLARQNVAEHVQSNPVPGVSRKDIATLLDIYKTGGSALHATAIHIVDALVARVAQQNSVDPDAIWGALIHAQMNGLDLGNKYIRTLLDSELGADFSRKLAHLKAEEIPGLLQKHGLLHRFEDMYRAMLELKKRIQKVDNQ